MSIRTSRWPAGVPNWAQLATSDPEAVKRFYGDVLGWEFDDNGIARRNGSITAGMNLAEPDEASAWRLYFASDDAAATDAAVTAAGGTVPQPGISLGDMGVISHAVDPAGCAFGYWQSGDDVGGQLVNEPGGLVWEQLAVRDITAQPGFYAQVFGFELQKMADPESAEESSFTMFAVDGVPIGGADIALPGQPLGWTLFFGVDDTDAAAAAATAAGGKVNSVSDSPWGRTAELLDPSGAPLSIIAVTGDALPDRNG